MRPPNQSLEKKTVLAFVTIRLLGTPFWGLSTLLLLFILYKQGLLSPLCLTTFIALRPISSLISPYWSQSICQRPNRIIPNLIGANILRYIPFLIFPWFHPLWYILLAFGLFMTLSRAMVPAWMELFKQHLPPARSEEIVGWGSMIDYLASALFTLATGVLLDHYQDIWCYLFAIGALLGLLPTLLLHHFPRPARLLRITATPIKQSIIRPWKKVARLLMQNPSFFRFQIGFMLGGAGLMMMQPALPPFFCDTLNLSFTEMGLAIALCKGLGVVLTTRTWTRIFRSMDLFSMSALVTSLAMIFPLLLLLSSWHLSLVYFAYGLYGIMQAGSEMSWHMSSLVFSKERDSSPFSITNVLAVGIRGCFIPALGAFFLACLTPQYVLLIGSCLCLTATGYFLAYRNTILTTDTTPQSL